MVDLALFALPNSGCTDPKMYFPLGIVYLAAVVEKAGYSVEVVDYRVKGLMPQAKYYGFSCATPQIGTARRLADAVKRQGKTIVGGPHPSLLPDDCIGAFDHIVVGEGEEIIVDIISGKTAPGIHVMPRITNLDKIPPPAWHKIRNPFSDTLFPGERYGKGDLAATTILSRGCPHKCSFCGNVFRTPLVFHGIERIHVELSQLVKQGITHFRFEDDNITLFPEFDGLCNMLHKLNISYKAHTRSDLINQYKVDMLRYSGCEELGLGIESADDDVLQLVGKRESSDIHRKACRIVKQSGMRLKTYFMTGLPGETNDTIRLNQEFFREIKPDKWTLSRFTPYPGCAIYKDPAKFGVIITDPDYEHYWNFPEKSCHELDNASVDVLDMRYNILYQWLRGESWR